MFKRVYFKSLFLAPTTSRLGFRHESTAIMSSKVYPHFSCDDIVKIACEKQINYLDVRSHDDCQKRRFANVNNIPFQELIDRRLFELPPRHVPFIVTFNHEQLGQVLIFFATRTTPWSIVAYLCADKPQHSYYSSSLLHAVSNNIDLEKQQLEDQQQDHTQHSQVQVFNPGHGKRYRRQLDGESAVVKSSDESVSVTTTVTTPVISVQTAIETLHITSVATSECGNSNVVDEDLWSLITDQTCLRDANTPHHDIVLFHPCPPLDRYCSHLESALIHFKRTGELVPIDLSAPPHALSKAITTDTSRISVASTITALDIGCGHGRDSLWLAKRDLSEYCCASDDVSRWSVLAVDEVVPMLKTIAATAVLHDVTRTLTVSRTRIRADGIISHKALSLDPVTTPNDAGMTSAGVQPTRHWETERFDLVLCVRFLVPALLPQLPGLISVGGYLVYSHFAEGCAHPANVLRNGQLAALMNESTGFEVILDEIEIIGDGRPVNNFIARRIR